MAAVNGMSKESTIDGYDCDWLGEILDCDAIIIRRPKCVCRRGGEEKEDVGTIQSDYALDPGFSFQRSKHLTKRT